MRIGIDISTLTRFLDGVNCYLLNLVEHLSLVDGENTYILYTNRKIKDLIPDIDIKGGNFSIRESDNSHRLVWMQAQLPFLLKRDRVDVLHSPCYNVPLVSGVPSVVTVHDMTSSLFPKQFVLKHRLIYSTMVPLSARKAARIIAVSGQTRDDITRIFNVAAEKIDVIHEGVNKKFYPRDKGETDRISEKYGLEKDYILFIGTLQPRKNLVYLVKAFDLFNRTSNKDGKYELVIAGKKGWFYKEIFSTVEKLGLASRVRFLGHVPEEDLPALYTGASLFVFPSLYEGFGLPPLESMACGTPVIASNTSCFPEVLGDSAVLVDPNDVSMLASEMARILYDGILGEKMVSLGFARAKEFTWEKMARETIQTYRSALGSRKSS
jgi:glycosyltransferase involved in cell wall biosynthesis